MSSRIDGVDQPRILFHKFKEAAVLYPKVALFSFIGQHAIRRNKAQAERHAQFQSDRQIEKQLSVVEKTKTQKIWAGLATRREDTTAVEAFALFESLSLRACCIFPEATRWDRSSRFPASRPIANWIRLLHHWRPVAKATHSTLPLDDILVALFDNAAYTYLYRNETLFDMSADIINDLANGIRYNNGKTIYPTILIKLKKTDLTSKIERTDNTIDHSSISNIPVWNKIERRLYFRNVPIRDYTMKGSVYQEAILDLFQEKNWQRTVSVTGVARKTLHEAVKTLNKGMNNRLIRFGRGGAKGMVKWEVLTTTHNPP